MFLNTELKNTKIIKREGQLKTVKLPSKAFGSYDVLIHVKDKELSFTDGDSIFIIDTQIGILEESEFTVFLADKYIVTELQWGRIYLKDTKGKSYYVTETGSVVNKNIDEEHIKWLTQEDLLVYLCLIVSCKYKIPSQNKSLVKDYIDNLSITIVSANVKVKNTDNLELKNYMFRFKVKDYYCDLGLDAFDYKTFEESEKTPSCPNDKSYDVAAWEEEKRQAKAEKHKEQKAELEYKRLKDGEDVIDTEICNFEDDDSDDEMDTEELHGLNGFSITEVE